MTGFALALVLVAACVHASWNFFAKRAGRRAAAAGLMVIGIVLLAQN